MKKMLSLFKRDFNNKECPAYNEYEDGVDFILNGEAIATQKFDGTACLIKEGIYYKRYKAKKERHDFLHWTFDKTQKTGHGWIPVTDTPDNIYHLEAWQDGLQDGTYELCGEKIQGNPEGIKGHVLLEHGLIVFDNVPIDFEGLKSWLIDKDIEGIVFHGKNGEMIKIKKSDFGFNR